MKIGTLLLLLAIPFSVAHAQSLTSGLPLNADCPAFDPYHVSGPDRNSRACPMCKYGSRQGVMVWVNSDDWATLEHVARYLETTIKARGLRNFRAFLIYMNPDRRPLPDILEAMRKKADAWKLEKTALVCIPSPDDAESAGLFQINPDPRVKNTVLVYSHRKVAFKKINLKAIEMDALLKSCDSVFLRNPL